MYWEEKNFSTIAIGIPRRTEETTENNIEVY
jgi:hypothetical protein